jgi:hypothetical protein
MNMGTVYICGRPIEQMIVVLKHGISPFGLITFALPITLLLGMLSWHLIETEVCSFNGLWETSTMRTGKKVWRL